MLRSAALDSYARDVARTERDRAELTGMFGGPESPTIRLPDPDDYADGSLERIMALRLRELDATHPMRERGRVLVERMAADKDAGDEWLLTMGRPASEGGTFGWDDEDDQL